MTTPRQHHRRHGSGRRARAACAGLSLALAAILGPDGTQDAVANGDTRAITVLHEHTKESATITFRRNGAYDPEALKQLNWILRDWRLDEPTRMDPRLFDIVWQVYREIGSQEPIHVVSAYRSPQTNAMLRHRSRAVAEHSQHMLGKAMDFYLPDVPMSRVRELGMKLQRGGVGFYPNAFNPFVHLDAGGVRSWPRMPRTQLASLFPDGRTVHMPRDGKPMPGYEEARATILARGGSVPGAASYADAGEETGPRRSLWATLFGGSEDEDSDFYSSPASRSPGAASRPATRVAAAGTPAFGPTAFSPAGNSDDAGTRSVYSARPAPEAPPASPLAPLADGPVLPSAPVRLLDAVPLPPRRPGDLAPLLLAAPTATPRPVATAMAGGADLLGTGLRGGMRPPAKPPGPGEPEERSALRALFAAALTRTVPEPSAAVATSRVRPQPLAASTLVADPGPNVRTVFTSARLDAPGPEAFSGPAVARLPARP